jgi:hypothetical protein
MEHVPAPADRLDAALVARLRALPQPDPGEAYFAALPDHVAARLKADGRTPAADRAPRRHARTRRAAWTSVAVAALIVLVYALPQTRRAADPRDARVAQQRPVPATPKPAGPAAVPGADTIRHREMPPVRREVAPRRSSNPTPERPRRAPTTARPRGAFALASAALPADLPVPSALVTTLERARVVLLTLAHADTTDDLTILQPLAEALVVEIAGQRAAFDAADPALRTVADRLEPLLLTLAHPDRTPGAMATLRAHLRDDEMLFRLDVALIAAAPAVSAR